MSRYDLAIFDFDGTIYNTFLGIARSSQHAMREIMGRDYPDLETFRKCIGPPLKDIFMSDHFGLTEDEAIQTVFCFRERYGRLGVLECEPYGGVREMLAALRTAGVHTAIASSKPEVMIRTILGNDGLVEAFDYITGIQSELDTSTKTDAVNRAIASFDVDKSRIVMVGDRHYDAEGAQNAGVDFIAAMYGFGTDAEFDPYPCVCRARTAQQMTDVILGA